MNELNNENQVETEEIIVDVEDTPINEEAVLETDSGGDDELDKYTKGVSKRINKLNDKIRLAEQKAADYESKYAQLSNEYNSVKTRANVLDKNYTEEYENQCMINLSLILKQLNGNKTMTGSNRIESRHTLQWVFMRT